MKVPSPGIVPLGAAGAGGGASAGAWTPGAFSSASARVGQSRFSAAIAACCLSGWGPASVHALSTAATADGGGGWAVVWVGGTVAAGAVVVVVTVVADWVFMFCAAGLEPAAAAAAPM